MLARSNTIVCSLTSSNSNSRSSITAIASWYSLSSSQYLCSRSMYSLDVFGSVFCTISETFLMIVTGTREARVVADALRLRLFSSTLILSFCSKHRLASSFTLFLSFALPSRSSSLDCVSLSSCILYFTLRDVVCVQISFISSTFKLSRLFSTSSWLLRDIPAKKVDHDKRNHKNYLAGMFDFY